MWPRAILLSKKRFNLNHTQCCRLPRFQTQHSFLICALQNQCTLFPMVLRRALINKISLPIHLLNLIIIRPPLFPPPSTDIILSAYSRVLNCRKHHLCKKSVLVSFGEGRQGKGHGYGRELKNVSKWSRVQENHHSLCEEAACAKYSLLSLWLKKQTKRFLGYDTGICAAIQNVARKDRGHPSSQLPNSHMTKMGLYGHWRGGCGSPRWPEGTEWIAHSRGALHFGLSVFTCMFIKDSNPSGKSGLRFSMWVAMLYYTWHLSIKEETLLKQTEVKLVLSSTSDLLLLLSSKRKFVLEQW